MSQGLQDFRYNNFDLLRLIAAFQVLIVHYINHFLPDRDPLIIGILGLMPGVPVFFFISGFLITKSWLNVDGKNRYYEFFKNRFLRLYPALFICIGLSILSIFLSGYELPIKTQTMKFIFWIGTQITILQFYNPDFMDGYGTGLFNGALWTISVELQFYLLTPLLVYLLSKNRMVVGILFLLFIVLNFYNCFLNERQDLWEKLLNRSFLPWFYMFFVGAYVAMNASVQKRILNIPLIPVVFIWLVWGMFSLYFDLGNSTQINGISFVLMTIVIFKLAYIKPNLSKQMLAGHDISYGIYIYHIPVLNFLIYKNYASGATGMITGIVITILLAILSWILVERPSLSLKHKTIRRH